MIGALIVLGLFDAPPSAGIETVDAPAERTISILRTPNSSLVSASLPLGAYRWIAALDPSDRVQWAIDWTDILETGETITAIEQLTMSATGAAVGVEIDDSTDRLPIIDTDGKKIQFWLLVDPAFQSNSTFSSSGIVVGISARINTSSDPARTYERTGAVTARQQ